MARPTKYSKELLEKAKNYLNVYETLQDVVPTVEGLSIYLEISRETLYRWVSEDDKVEFSDTVKEINATQKQVLINKGLVKLLNSS